LYVYKKPEDPTVTITQKIAPFFWPHNRCQVYVLGYVIIRNLYGKQSLVVTLLSYFMDRIGLGIGYTDLACQSLRKMAETAIHL
jgi:hypothetical protein